MLIFRWQKPEPHYSHDPGDPTSATQQDIDGVHGDHACLTYDNTRGMVQNVLAGLANLESELRHALSGQFGRSLKQVGPYSAFSVSLVLTFF